MAGAFSGHLLNTFNTAQPNTHPTITSGTMSFDARMHGTPGPSSSLIFSPMPQPFLGSTPLSEDSTSAERIATLQAKLNRKLGPEFISQRPGPSGGPKLTYAEGWKIINLANEVFGFNGWSSSVVNITTDFVDYIEESRRFNVGVTAIVRVTLRDGAYHEDVGYGMLENAKSKAAALDKCKKEAVTDALKRTLRNFGNLLGNCLYDKSYAQEVVKIKVPPAKFDKNELYRRPEFEESVPDLPPSAPHGQPVVPELLGRHEEPRVKVEHDNHEPQTPITYVPRHLRQEMAAAAQQNRTTTRSLPTPPHGAPPRPSAQTITPGSRLDTISAVTNRGQHLADGVKPNGPITPIRTPMQAQRPPPRAATISPLSRIRSAPERSVSAAEPTPVPDAGFTNKIDDPCHDIDDDDGFPISTQDGALFATVDLGESDLGRPIDYDEGVGGNLVDTPVLEQGSESSPQHQLQQCDCTGNESSGGLSSCGLSKTSVRNELRGETVAKPTPGSGGHLRGGSTGPASMSTPSTSSFRTGPTVQDARRPVTNLMGGFHIPQGPKPPVHVPKPVMPACVRTNSSTPQGVPSNTLKRNADMMQASSATSARPPTHSMGLAQRQQQHQRDAIACRPSDNSEGNDPKRLKR